MWLDARLAFHHVVVKRYNDVNRVKNIVKGAEAEQGTSALDMHGDSDAATRRTEYCPPRFPPKSRA